MARTIRRSTLAVILGLAAATLVGLAPTSAQACRTGWRPRPVDPQPVTPRPVGWNGGGMNLRDQAAQLDARAIGLEGSASERERSARAFLDRAKKLRERAAGLSREDRDALVAVAEDLEVQSADEKADAARARAEARRLRSEADRLRRQAASVRFDEDRPWPPPRDRFAPAPPPGSHTTPVVF